MFSVSLRTGEPNGQICHVLFQFISFSKGDASWNHFQTANEPAMEAETAVGWFPCWRASSSHPAADWDGGWAFFWSQAGIETPTTPLPLLPLCDPAGGMDGHVYILVWQLQNLELHKCLNYRHLPHLRVNNQWIFILRGNLPSFSCSTAKKKKKS